MRSGTETVDRSDRAVRLDTSIDALLAGRAALADAAEPDEAELVATARLLHEGLPRFHPRFSFEELLARRLIRGHADIGDANVVVALTAAPDEVALDLASTTARDRLRRRGLVAGGAIASGLSLAIPLAGAALVAWRRSRSTGGIG